MSARFVEWLTRMAVVFEQDRHELRTFNIQIDTSKQRQIGMSRACKTCLC